MAGKPFNPYHDLAAVRTPQMFFGRTQLLHNLFSAIVAQQSVSLVGPRHIGKSSVLLCMRFAEIQKGFSEYDLSRHILVFIDLREYLYKTCDDFFRSVSQLIMAACRGVVDINLSRKKGDDEFSAILDQIKEQDFHPVLLMDAFDNIMRNEQFDARFLSFLRSQYLKVSYITASIAPLHEICHQSLRESPFFNIFSTEYVNPFTHEEAQDLARRPAERIGVPFTESEVEWALKLAGKHPFFLQRVCHFLFEEKALEAKGSYNIHRVRKEAYHDLRPHFDDLWSLLTEQQQETLRHTFQLSELQQRKLVEESATERSPDSHLELSESDLFREFVNNKYGERILGFQLKDIEEALERLDDLLFLGKSNLRHLNIVSLRLKGDTVPSTIEVGIAVREALNEAFESLRGHGQRSDTSYEWKLYNILHYRYFRKHLKNEYIAAKLTISTRQYFRDKSKALEVLLKTLLEMEASSHR